MENKAKLIQKVDTANRTIVLTRVFDAPRKLVFKVITDPKLLPQWWGPKNLTTKVETMEVRPGGAWRYVQHDPEGNEFAFHGVYREIVPPERLVYTFEWEALPGHEILETVTLEDLAGQTKMTTHDLFQTVEDLEGMLKAGMEGGADESFERLTKVLAAERVAR